MKINIDKAPDGSLKLEVLIPKGAEHENSLMSAVTSSHRIFWEYVPAGTYWQKENTESATVFKYSITGVWASDVVSRWARRFLVDAAYTVEIESSLSLKPAKSSSRKAKAQPKEPEPYPAEFVVFGQACANIEQVEAALGEPDSLHDLGSFEVQGESMRVTDPCYDKQTWCTGMLNVVPGTWHAATLLGDTTWHRRVKQLRVRLNGIAEDIFSDLAKFKEADFSAGVDSGQCGFFDETIYPTDIAQFEYKGDTFYSRCCAATGNEQLPGGAVIAGGVVSRSGFGDGGYAVKVATNEHGKVIAAFLEYVSDADDEDEDGEEDESEES